MQPGSPSVTRELNTIIDDLSGERCLCIGWLDTQHKALERLCMSGLYNVPTVGDAFINNQHSLVSGDAEDVV